MHTSSGLLILPVATAQGGLRFCGCRVQRQDRETKPHWLSRRRQSPAQAPPSEVPPELPTQTQTFLHYSELVRPRGPTPVYPNPPGADLKASTPTY